MVRRGSKVDLGDYMEKYTLDTDFSSLKGSQTYDWMLEFYK